MMDASTALVALLLADSAVSALVADRIGAATLPERMARPNITYQLISAQRVNANDGPAGLVFATIQVSCWADAHKTAKQVAAAVRERLNGFTGSAGGLTVQSLLLDDERDAPRDASPDSGTAPAGVHLTFRVAYSE
jgi:hypothetical protein